VSLLNIISYEILPSGRRFHVPKSKSAVSSISEQINPLNIRAVCVCVNYINY